MSAIIVESSFREKLIGVKAMTELRDADGRLLGHFVPPGPIFPWAPNLTAEELKRSREGGGGQRLSEIIKNLSL